MNDPILDYFSDSRVGYLHANGATSTKILIQLIDCQAQESVLEVGFGTGTTIIRMASTFKKTSFFGVDVSEKMCKTASGRVRFSLLNKRIKLQKWAGFDLPFGNRSIDKIYIESVLAIQSKKQLEALLSEIARVLKHDGILLFNETIWLETTSKEIIHQVNLDCLKAFGIIQATADYPYLTDWLSLLEKRGFDVERVLNLSDIESTDKLKSKSRDNLLSKIYSNIGWWKAKTNPKLRRDWKTYKKNMETILKDTNPLMSGFIIVAKNKS